MKIFKYIYFFTAIATSIVFVQCKDEDDNVIINATCGDGVLNGSESEIDCGGPDCPPCGEVLDFSGTYVQEDQIGRPAINTIFGMEGFTDAFNGTVPSEMQADFQERFQFKLIDSTGFNPAFSTNVLGFSATEFTAFLSNDVLWLAQTGPTAYYNGTEVFTGRALSNDVIDNTLLFIFGGPNGSDNPELISDGVPANDAAFPATFPYLAAPF